MARKNSSADKSKNQSINVAVLPGQSNYPASNGDGQPKRRRTRGEMKIALQSDPTKDYQSSRFSYYGELFVQNLPMWRIWTARMMLTSDPIVNFSMNIRNAALMAAEVVVESPKPEIKKWVEDQWQYIWNYQRAKIVSAKKWGYAGLQPMYKEDDKQLLKIVGMKDFAPEDVRALEQSHRICGARVKGKEIFFPQSLWLSFGSEFGSAYGVAITRRQYPAWYEKWMERGAKRLQQLRMIKDAYIGDIFWYPPNIKLELPDGKMVPWKDVMRELGENRYSGGALTLPRFFDNGGKELTGYTPPQNVPGATEIFQWVDLCDQNILRGADVPFEVIEAADTGSGFSGRSIPFLVLLSVCNQEFVEIVQQIDERILRPIAWLNWGGDPDYKIIPKNLVKSFSSDIQGSSMAGGSIGGPPGEGPPAQGPPPPSGTQQFNEQAVGVLAEQNKLIRFLVERLDRSVQYNEEVAKAAAETEKPTEAQAKAGNYRKGKVSLHGLTISIENPKGTERNPDWPELAAHYGYINRTEGKDGDHVDCFIGDNPDSEIVFVIDQVNKSGRFDEHKAVLGTTSEEEARKLYLSCYTKDWKVGPITAMTVSQFRAWLEKGDTKKPIEGQTSQYEEDIDTQQFREGNPYHEALAGHGYYPTFGVKGSHWKLYHHPSGHSVEVETVKGGAWRHTSFYPRGESEGKGHKSLRRHLGGLHGTSNKQGVQGAYATEQHDEAFDEEDSEPTYLKLLRNLRGMIGRGEEAAKKRVKALAEQIKELDPALPMPDLEAAIAEEIRKLTPYLGGDLAADALPSAFSGSLDLLNRLPTVTPSPKATASSAVPGWFTVEPSAVPILPDLTGILFGSGEVPPESVVHLPVLEAAVETLRTSPVATGADYHETAELVKQGAFAITADMTDKAVADVRDTLAKVLEEGKSQKEFIAEVVTRLESEGSPLSPPHIENVFRTNTMAAYGNAQYKLVTDNPMVTDAFPYVMRSATRDARVRPQHWALGSKLGLNGTNVYRADDPTWIKFRAPWSYNCRCRDTFLGVDQAARAGIKEAQAWLERAKATASTHGGSFYQYLRESAPGVGEHVTPPNFEPPPEFDRTASQFAEVDYVEPQPDLQTMLDKAVAKIPPPSITVNAHFQVPETPPPIIENRIEAQPVAEPATVIVHNTVNVPEQPPPVVEINVPPPAKQTIRVTERDGDGKIKELEKE